MNAPQKSVLTLKRDTRTTDAKVEQFIAGLGMFGAPQRNRPASRKRAGRKIRKARGR